jgi:serine protease Do
MEARGSGFIIDADGTVVTNNHVVKGARTVMVTMSDGTELKARVIGRDARTDIAVLKVDAGRKLPFVSLGDSRAVRPGEWVVAMGNPFGLGGTVTAGIVSAQGRDIGSGPYDDYIQIDAPINQGNSGGPLFTQDGHVVGINSAIISPSGGSVGIGFAIPANMVRTVVADLQHDGKVTRGYLGIETQPVTAAMATAMHLPSTGNGHDQNGALVAGVSPDSPADKAGVQAGDVVQAIDGHAVKSPRDLAVDVAGIKPGNKVALDVVRDGKAQSLTVAVAAMPDTRTASRDAAPGDSVKVGLQLAPLSPQVRGELDLPKNVEGAVVAGVVTGSPAETAGLREGDVIVGVGNKKVSDPEQAVGAIRAAAKDDKALALRVMRDGHTAFVAVDLSRAAPASDDSAG